MTDFHYFLFLQKFPEYFPTYFLTFTTIQAILSVISFPAIKFLQKQVLSERGHYFLCHRTVLAAPFTGAAFFRSQKYAKHTFLLYAGWIFPYCQANLTETEVFLMETRVAVMGIIVEDMESVEKLNALLHEFSEYIIGRMGIPYRTKKISIVSVAIDAPQNIISTLSGKIGNLHGVSVKIAYSNVVSQP